MSLRETFSLALKNILGSRMRTFLTMLGIIIGVTAVIVIIGMGNGIENYMADSFSSMGTDTLTVSISGRGSSRSVSEEDMYRLVEENPDYLEAISPTVTMSGTVKIGSESLSSTSVTGVSEDYFSIGSHDIAQGRNIQYMDVEERKTVCVIGSYLAFVYYGGDAVGQSVRINGDKYTIVGVMAQETDDAGDLEEGGIDDCIYIPYSTAARLSGTGSVSSYTISVTDEDNISRAMDIVESALYEVFDDSDAYTVVSMSEMLDMMNSMISIVITILAAIAGISLLVGGIGIMNIMLVSVTERTREIGIRKALGAKESSIMKQFVIESGTTSALGGVLGILLGYILCSVASPIITSLMDAEITVSPSVASALLAFGISVSIGVLFGYLPARKASRLNPIDALRHD